MTFHPKMTSDMRDKAETKWRRFSQTLSERGLSVSVAPEVANLLKPVLFFSEFVENAWNRWPETATSLLDTGDLTHAYGPSRYAESVTEAVEDAADEAGLCRKLRRLRCREMTRIAVRDIAGLADLNETILDLSDFAEAAIDGALTRLHEWHSARYGTPMDVDGHPQQLVVVGMGKLGAGELNFSSDIDLIFAYPRGGETQGGPSAMPNADYFLRLGRRLIHVLGANTPDGFVFRVDMNLRPFGESGPLVLSFDAMEAYYQEQGREWERYAWIKAQTVAGDKTAGERLLRRLRPFVYRRYLDYGVFEALRDMKSKIKAEVARKGMEGHIKLGAGGIREVEFFGQIFQLIRGGVITAFQERRIQSVLSRLTDAGYIDRSVHDRLQAAYVFLRTTEHRLQQKADAQTHLLPKTSEDKAALAAVMGFPDAASFDDTLQAHRNFVHRQFNNLLRTDAAESPAQDLEKALRNFWKHPSDEPEALRVLKTAGFPDPLPIARTIVDFRAYMQSLSLSDEGRDRIHRFLPPVLKKTGQSERPAVALDRILTLLKSIRKRTSYVSLLIENPQALDHLVRLANTSAWILTFLCRHPLLLDELMDHRTLFTPPERRDLETELADRMAEIDPEDLELRMDGLRIFKQTNVLRVAAADVTDAIPLMRVSDHLSDIAETLLAFAVAMAWDHLVEKHGRPEGLTSSETNGRGFVIIAYGKLGGIELGYDSDLDLVFLHAGGGAATTGPRPIDTTTFYARLGQRVLHILTAHTATGRLYEADMRLRPSGDSGILVSGIESFRTYQMEEAWTWEKQALVRARPVVGDDDLKRRFLEIREEVLTQPRAPEILRREITDMRFRLQQEHLKSDTDEFDLKQGRGGMVDIEFLVQYLVLQHAERHPEILEWTDNVRLIGSLADAGVIDPVTAYLLRKAYLTYRSMGHKLNLREQPASVAEERFTELRRSVRSAWRRYLGD